MSATFLANGRDACVLGFNRQIVRGVGVHPFVYHGVIGPVPVSPAVGASVKRAVRGLTIEFGLRGLGSLDFLCDGDAALVLEVNPRPPASLALYPDVGGAGVMGLHLRACRWGELPAMPSPPTPVARLRGTEIVFARAPLRLGEADAARLAGWPGCHDLPRAGSTFEVGDPVCSIDAEGRDADEVEADLARLRDALLDTLETTT
jgi:predicted ATP-grasp superfamily ATP-dependent carboligase